MKTKEIHTKEFWDARSELCVKDFNCKSSRQENEDRYQYTDDFLVAQGLYNGNSEILDIGCGPGMFTARFAEKARSVTGLDISGKMVEYARQNTEQSL